MSSPASLPHNVIPPKVWRNIVDDISHSLGFSAVGVARVTSVEESVWNLRNSASQRNEYLPLPYINNYPDIRKNPSRLLSNAQSIIVVAENYYPPIRQKEHAPQISYYAYGKDYHKVLKKKLDLFRQCLEEKANHPIVSRSICDSAPFMDQYWAKKSGIGYIGKSGLLIIPQKGSFHFLGFLLVDIEIEADNPFESSLCGRCTRCIDACPTGAIRTHESFDASRCISCLTIEDKRDSFSKEEQKAIGNHLYGCDICQKVCPHNRFAVPHQESKFHINPTILSLEYEQINRPDRDLFERIASGSAIRRIGYEQFLRNSSVVLYNYFQSLPVLSPWKSRTLPTTDLRYAKKK